MLRFLFKTSFDSTIFPNNGASTTTILSLLQNPSFIRFLSTTSTAPTNPTTSSSSSSAFTVSYLINSCGLPEQKALSAAKKVYFETSSKPDSVLTLLKNYGFTNTHISKIIEKNPLLLLSDPEKTLQPKFDFFLSIGISSSDLSKVLSTDPTVLIRSLDNQIIPSYNFLKKIVGTDREMVSVIKRSTWVFLQDPEKQIVPNINLLRYHGVPDKNIVVLLITQPRALLQSVGGFKETVEKVKELKFDPLKGKFVRAIHGLTSISNWESKMEVYRKWGWSNEEILEAFRKHPFCMMASENKIVRNMDFFVNVMGFKPSLIAKHPLAVSFSLEKRIIPRCLVMQILVACGLVEKDISLNTVLIMSEKLFLERFVAKFAAEIPGLFNVYKRNANGKIPIAA